MSKAKLSVCIVLSCLSIGVAYQDQMTVERIYLRSTVKGYPAAEGRPLVNYLDSQRPIADKGMQLIAEGKLDALYELMSADTRKQVTLEQLRNIFVAFDQLAGKITSYEYRNQAILFPNDQTPMSDLSKAKSQVWYSIKTTKPSGNAIFIAVKTSRENGTLVVSWINYLDYGDRMPPWLRYVDAPGARS